MDTNKFNKNKKEACQFLDMPPYLLIKPCLKVYPTLFS